MTEQAGPRPRIRRATATRSRSTTNRCSTSRSDVTAGGEQGLLGLAFSPTAARCTSRSRTATTDQQLDEFTLSTATASSTPRRAARCSSSPTSRRTTTAATSSSAPTASSTGRWATAAAPATRSQSGQNPNDLLGNILRIDPTHAGRRPAVRHPAPTTRSRRRRRRARGVAVRAAQPVAVRRSTARRSDLWIGDVGQNAIEESRLPARRRHAGGQNFGWSDVEGTHPFTGDGPPAGAVPPIYEYDHSGGRCSITGGLRVPRQRHPGARGHVPVRRLLRRRDPRARARGRRQRHRDRPPAARAADCRRSARTTTARCTCSALSERQRVAHRHRRRTGRRASSPQRGRRLDGCRPRCRPIPRPRPTSWSRPRRALRDPDVVAGRARRRRAPPAARVPPARAVSPSSYDMIVSHAPARDLHDARRGSTSTPATSSRHPRRSAEATRCPRGASSRRRRAEELLADLPRGRAAVRRRVELPRVDQPHRVRDGTHPRVQLRRRAGPDAVHAVDVGRVRRGGDINSPHDSILAAARYLARQRLRRRQRRRRAVPLQQQRALRERDQGHRRGARAPTRPRSPATTGGRSSTSRTLGDVHLPVGYETPEPHPRGRLHRRASAGVACRP